MSNPVLNNKKGNVVMSKTTYNYTIINDNIMQNKELNSTSKLVYSRLAYRMHLSVTKGNTYYDKSGNFYYVVYQYKDLENDTGSGKKAVRNAIKQLVSLGLVKKHKPLHFTRVLRFELPKFRLDTSVSAERKPVDKNNIKNNRYDSNYDSRLKGVENRKQDTDIKMPKHDTKLDKQNANKASKHLRIPKVVTDNLARDVGGNKLFQCIHILAITARRHFIKKFNHAKWIKNALDYDINEYYRFNHGRSFAKYIDHGLRKAFHNARNMYAYFMSVCKHYYKYAITWYRQNYDLITGTKKDSGPGIPIFKI